MPKYTKTPPAKKTNPTPQTDYSKYKIDYGEVDRKLSETAFDQRVPNTHIYYLLGWSKAKFYGICKAHIDFIGYLEAKREQARAEKLAKYTNKLDELALKGNNIAAVIFGLKALGIHDVPQPRPEEKDRPRDDTLDLKDCTLSEMKVIKKISDRVNKRRDDKAKKVTV